MEENDIQDWMNGKGELTGDAADDVLMDSAFAEDGAVDGGLMDSGFAEDGTADGGFIDGGFIDGGSIDGGFGDGSLETGTGAKDPVLSSVPFVAGTICAALVLGMVFGILLGRKRIKKGFDSYENE